MEEGGKAKAGGKVGKKLKGMENRVGERTINQGGKGREEGEKEQEKNTDGRRN